MTMPDTAVVGGSLGGLTAALLLRDAGCQVTVYERSPAVLEARGAGIAVLEQTLRYPVERLGLSPEQISTSTQWIRFVEADGATGHQIRQPYRFSAWNTIYQVLHEAFGDEQYLLGKELTGFATTASGVELSLADGEVRQTDLLVCADGISSISRQQMFPQVVPRYAGYVAWRGTLPEGMLSESAFEALKDAITYQVLPHSHILVYPIPGDDGAVEPGRRLVNMVWYRNVAEPDLAGFMTDRAGEPHRVSLPPGSARSEVIDEMRLFAEKHLAPQIAEMVTAVPEPFVQAVFDVEVPGMRRGAACLIGDAAFGVRPHAAAGTAKAAEDGWVLAEELINADGDVEVGLATWELRQMALGSGLLARTREIGDSSQFTGRFTPGDPSLVFGLYGPGR